jgi:hypothetical protein
VLARYVGNKHLAGATHQWAFCALTASPGARAYYDAIRSRGVSHHAALRQLANRLARPHHPGGWTPRTMGCLSRAAPAHCSPSSRETPLIRGSPVIEASQAAQPGRDRMASRALRAACRSPRRDAAIAA